MRTPTAEARQLWEDICRVLIEAGEPLPTDLICARVHQRMTQVYPRLRQLEDRGIIKADRNPMYRHVAWEYVGEDIARQAQPVDLDTPP